jgi:mannose-6-phosphate isomerase-like protein (cupin superfamily)
VTQNSPISLKQISDSYLEKHKSSIVSEINDSCLRLAVNEGIFDWHYHPNSDELFLVLEGCLTIEFHDQRSVELRPGDIFSVPAKKIHRTVAKNRTVNLCFELTKSETVFLQNERAQDGAY